MATIDLYSMTKKFQQENYINGEPKFTALKLELSQPQWNVDKKPSKVSGAARSFEMSNTSPATGQGHLQTLKEGKPTTTVNITQGALNGFPKRTSLTHVPPEFKLGDVINFEMGKHKTQVVDPTMLQVDADVDLQSHQIKIATVENAEVFGGAKFTCYASLRGNVIFEFQGQVDVVTILREGNAPVDYRTERRREVAEWLVRGHLQVNIEDNQTLRLE